ncbi:MAG: adenylosuccinate synthase [Vulcanimicrobiota bacterium]
MSTLVVGAQYGDEGKGKIVDSLLEDGSFDCVVRYNGGNNAGHTIVWDGVSYPLHLIPSGILYPRVSNIIGAGVVVCPEGLVDEIETLTKRGVNCSNLYLSDRAHLVMPWHKVIDGHKAQELGTTAKGIGPCYEDRASRRGLRVGELVTQDGRVDVKHFSDRFRSVATFKNDLLSKIYALEPLDVERELARVLELAEKFAHLVCDTAQLLQDYSRQGKSLLFEGAQGCLLDIDWGSYPYVTSSSVTLGSCVSGSGTAFVPERRIGIVKAYSTRVGEGPYLGELGEYDTIKTQDLRGQVTMTEEDKEKALAGDELLMGRWLRLAGQEYGTTTGRPRRTGWLDLVAVKHSVQVSGLTELALTKLDVLAGIPRLKLVVGYRDGDQVIRSLPSRIHHLAACTPQYEEFEGFGEIAGIKQYSELPETARRFIDRIEEFVGIPVRIVSVGPGRAEHILKSHG